MKRILLFITLVVIGLSAFSQSPSLQVSLRPAYPLAIGDTIVDSVLYSNNGIYLHDVDLDSLPRYEIGEIGTQTVKDSEKGHGFYVKADSLHSQAVVYSYEVNEEPKGRIDFNESTGKFKFYPALDDYKSFVVTFMATNGIDDVSENVEFNLMPPTPSEADAFHSEGVMPDASDYTIVAESSKNMHLNNADREAYSYSISGKDVVFDKGVNNKVWGLDGRNDIYELNIYAERLIVKSALSFPGTNVTIYAKELIFEDKGNMVSSISTTPLTKEELTDGSGVWGENAGDISLYIKEFKANMGIRFIAQGAQGQSSNKNGNPGAGGNGGMVTSTVDVSRCCDLVRGSGGIKYESQGGAAIDYGSNGLDGGFKREDNQYAYLHPYFVAPVLRHASDAFINNYTDEVLQTCREYKALITECLENGGTNGGGTNEGIQIDPGGLLDGDTNSGIVSEEDDDTTGGDATNNQDPYAKWGETEYGLQDNLMEIEKMLFKLEQGLDYFGNPEGWVPLLSFEVMYTVYQNEINRAIPTLYLSYWLRGIDRQLQQQMEASQSAANLVEEELNSDIDKLNGLVLEIPILQDEAQMVSDHIDELIKKIEKLEKKLYAKAKHNVKKRNRLKKFFGIGKAVATVISCIPGWGTAIGTALNVGLTVGESFVDDGQSSVDFGEIVSAINSTSNGIFYSNFTSSIANARNSIEAHDLEGLYSAYSSMVKTAQPLISSITNLKNLLSKSSTPKSEVQKEYYRLLASSSLWKQYNNDYAELDAQKSQLLNHLNQVFSDMTTTMSDISSDTHALDALKRDAFTGNSKRDLNAMLYLAKMEQRTKDRLLEYHYYLRKAYEYRLLEPYEGEEYNLVKIFQKFEEIAANDSINSYNKEIYDNLSSVFWEDLSNMTKKALDEYNKSHRKEWNSEIFIALDKDQLDILNSGQELTLNLYDMDKFHSNEEDIRIVGFSIAPEDFEAHTEGAISYSDYMDVELKHSGISQFRKDGKLYWFDHRSRSLVSSNLSDTPHKWKFRYHAYNGNISTLGPSADDNSLLSIILDKNVDDIMLFSRPSAWSDITLSKNDETGSIVVDKLVLRLQYDFTDRPNNYCNIDIKTNEHILPYVACSAEDVNGRKNGNGSFSRLYLKNNLPVNFNAVDKYETYHFVNWTNKAGTEVSNVNDLGAIRNKDQKFIANYERRVPILEVQDTIKVSNAGGTHSVRIRNVGKGDIEMDWHVEYADTTRTSSDSWVQLNGVVEGINDGEFTFDYKPNESGTVRMDSLEIFVPETDEMSKVIYIVQVEDPKDFVVYADTLNLLSGGDGAITLWLDNKSPVAIVDFDLYLPQGINLKTDEEGHFEASLNQDRSNGHLLEVEQRDNGLYHFRVNSTSNNSLIGSSGVLLTVNVTCGKDMAGGTYNGVVKNILLYGINKNEITKPDTTFVINVQSFEMGDVNHDQKVDVADVMLMVKHVMNKNPQNFFIENADVNGDSRYDVADVMGIVRISLGRSVNAPVEPQSDGLYLLSHGNNYMLTMDNAPVFTAFQTEIVVPNGGRLVNVDVCRGNESSHQVSYKDMGNGRYNLMVFSLGDKTFGNDGNLIRFNIEGSPNGDVKMENTRFTNQECEMTHFKSPQFVTNVEGLEINGEEQPFYNLEGVRTNTPQRGVYIQSGKKKTVK